jgi:hypothetical protein
MDPVAIGMRFCKAKHARGDLKNHEAAVEDALKRAGCLPDDDQIQGRLFSEIEYYSATPGVKIVIGIHDMVRDQEWLLNWFKRKKKIMLQYQAMRGLVDGLGS